MPESMAGRGKEAHSETSGDPAVQSLRESVKSLELKVNVIANDLQKVLTALTEIKIHHTAQINP